MSKLRLKSLQATAILILIASAGFAQSQIPRPQGLVNDFAGKLTGSTKQELETLLSRFRDRSNIELTVVTVPFDFLADQPIETYSLELGRRWGVGSKAGGLILLIAIKPQASDGTFGGATRLEVSRQLEKDIPNPEAGELIRRMRNELRQGHFDEALTNGVQTIVARLAEKRNISLEDLASIPAVDSQQGAPRLESGVSPDQPPSPPRSDSATKPEKNQQKNGWSFSTVLILIVGLPLLIISVIAMAFLRAMSKLNNAANRSSNPSRLFYARDAQASSPDHQSHTSNWSESHNFSGFSDTSSSSSFSDTSSSSSWSDSSSISSSDSSSSSSNDFGGGGSTDSW